MFYVISMKRLIVRFNIVVLWFYNSLNDYNDKKLNLFFLFKRYLWNKCIVFKRIVSVILVLKVKYIIFL